MRRRSRCCISHRALWTTVLLACADPSSPPPESAPTSPPLEPSSALPFDALYPIDFATYEGSHQVVHPDYAVVPAGAFGLPRQIAITPYPFGDAKHENPSLFTASDPDRWMLAERAPNPLVRPDRGYLSDPDLVYVPEHQELWLYYRQVIADNIVWLMRSGDGRTWSAPVEVARAPNHQLVSPSIVRRAANDWWMFSINSGVMGCGAASTTIDVRRSDDGMHWSEPAPATLTHSEFWPWHIDVQWIPSAGVFWAVYNAKTKGGCTTPALFIASSADGLSWEPVTTPVLAKGRSPEFQDIVYRSTFAYDPQTDAITFWYSGAKFDAGRYVWSAAVERRRRANVFAMKLKTYRANLFAPAPAPLADWP